MLVPKGASLSLFQLTLNVRPLKLCYIGNNQFNYLDIICFQKKSCRKTRNLATEGKGKVVPVLN
jgi:hypothetical protein